MRYLHTLLFTVLSTQILAQLNYVNTDWVINQNQVMADGDADTLELDIDQDGTKDMRISSWSNHQSGIQTAIEVLMLDAVGFGGLQNLSCSYLADCPSSGFNYSSITGYIYTSGCPNPHSNQYVKMPFKFQGSTGIHYGLLYVRYVGTTITVEGYVWNATPNTPVDCTTTEWLSLNELHMNELKEDFQYYNLIGQQVNSPSGLALKVYASGYTEKLFINN